MEKVENWKKWYKKNKEALIVDFVSFIERLKIGDMDLNTYCRYRYFVYQNEEKLVETYVQNKKDKGNDFLIKAEEKWNNDQILALDIYKSIQNKS